MGEITSKCQACQEIFTLDPPINNIPQRCYTCETFYSYIEKDTKLIFTCKQKSNSYIGNIQIYTPKTHIYLKSRDMKILVPKGVYIIVAKCRNGSFSFHLPEVITTILEKTDCIQSLDMISLLSIQEKWWNNLKLIKK